MSLNCEDINAVGGGREFLKKSQNSEKSSW
jgi:hypothetical protein